MRLGGPAVVVDRSDIPMHRNPANGYRLLKRSDLDKNLKKAAKPVNSVS
jgi:hypothetical protein